MFNNLKIIYKLTDIWTKPRPINGYSCKQLPVFRKIKCRFCQAYEIARAGRVRLGGIIDKYYYINKLLEYTNTRSCTFDPFAQILSYITTLKSEHSKYFFKSVANAQDIFNAALCAFWIFYYSTNLFWFTTYIF